MNFKLPDLTPYMALPFQNSYACFIVKISFGLTYTGEYTVIELSTKAPNVPVRNIYR